MSYQPSDPKTLFRRLGAVNVEAEIEKGAFKGVTASRAKAWLTEQKARAARRNNRLTLCIAATSAVAAFAGAVVEVLK